MKIVGFISSLFFSEKVYTYSEYMMIKTSEINPITSFIKITVYFISFIIVLVLAYYFSKFISIKTSGFIKGRNINIIEMFNIGKNNKIIIIKINNYVYVLSMGNNYTTVIDKIPYKEFCEDTDFECTDENKEKTKFDMVLKSISNRNERNSDILDLSILHINKKLSGIKDRIKRLQEYRISNCKDKSSDEDEKNE